MRKVMRKSEEFIRKNFPELNIEETEISYKKSKRNAFASCYYGCYIEVNIKYNFSFETLVPVLIHELIHRKADTNGHGKIFKKYSNEYTKRLREINKDFSHVGAGKIFNKKVYKNDKYMNEMLSPRNYDLETKSFINFLNGLNFNKEKYFEAIENWFTNEANMLIKDDYKEYMVY